jgi:hypothetical protein
MQVRWTSPPMISPSSTPPPQMWHRSGRFGVTDRLPHAEQVPARLMEV